MSVWKLFFARQTTLAYSLLYISCITADQSDQRNTLQNSSETECLQPIELNETGDAP
jgi:hypothetical protein